MWLIRHFKQHMEPHSLLLLSVFGIIPTCTWMLAMGSVVASQQVVFTLAHSVSFSFGCLKSSKLLKGLHSLELLGLGTIISCSLFLSAC